MDVRDRALDPRPFDADVRPSIEREPLVEPMKVGAVVEDAQGNLFIRHTTAPLAPWIGASTNVDHNPDRPYRYWSGTKAVAIHSEGVVPT